MGVRKNQGKNQGKNRGQNQSNNHHQSRHYHRHESRFRREKIWNLPNFLSLFRIIAVPIWLALYFSPHPKSGFCAGAFYIIVMATDVLDGYIARKYELSTDFGKFIDPVGDKLINIAIAICLGINKIVPVVFVAFFVLKELLMFGGGVIIYVHKLEIPASDKSGKAVALLLFVCNLIFILWGKNPIVAQKNLCLYVILLGWGLINVLRYGVEAFVFNKKQRPY